MAGQSKYFDRFKREWRDRKQQDAGVVAPKYVVTLPSGVRFTMCRPGCVDDEVGVRVPATFHKTPARMGVK